MFEALRNQLRKVSTKASDAVFGIRVLNQTKFLSALTPAGLASFARNAAGLRPGPHLALILHAVNKPEKTALVDGARRYTFRELNQEINQLGHGLVEIGAGPGKHVALMLPNCAEFIIAQQTIARIGATSVQIGNRLKAGEIAHILDNATPRATLVHHDYLAQMNQALAARNQRTGTLIVVGDQTSSVTAETTYQELIAGQPGDRPPATKSRGGGIIIYTSGTTGNPKGASRSMADTSLVSVGDFMTQVGMTHDDRHLVVCPLYHSAAPAFSSMTIALGGTLVLIDHFEPESVLATIEREQITGTFMVPTMLSRLAALDRNVRRRYDTSSLHWVLSGAAPLPTTTAHRFQEAFGYLLWNFYGSTETGLVTLAGPHDHQTRPGTVGRRLRGNQIRLVDNDGNEIPVGEVGELYACNEMLIDGYHRNATATRSSMREDFFSVGDLARIDADGYYYMESRKHDMVISGGVNIYPREIENHLHSHPDIFEVAIIGVPDPEWGESLKAFIVQRPGTNLTSQEVVEFCRDHLADYKRPRQIEFLDALPRTPTGKILKRELRER